MAWKASSIAIYTLLLIGISAGTISIHVAKSTPPSIPPGIEPIPRDQFNETIPEIQFDGEYNITVLPPWYVRQGPPIISQPSYYGVLPLSLRNLAVEAMVSGWVAVLVSCLTFYALSRRFVWGRKKILVVSILTILGGASLTVVSWFYQVKPYVLDAEYIYYGYPFTWLSASRSTFWGSPEWQYETQLYGLVGNIVFYMWIIFGSLVGFMILHKRIRKNPQLQKTS